MSFAFVALFLGACEGDAPGSRHPNAAPSVIEVDAGAARGGESIDGVVAPSRPAGAELTPLRLGWQTTWATQGQLVAVLLRTDILARTGFAVELRGYAYGAPLNEAAVAGEVDVVFTADQPALALAARAPSWGIVGRLMYNRVGTVVPISSPVDAPRDLAGKTLAVPSGAAAQREAMEAIHADGLDPTSDVRMVDRSAEHILRMVRAGAKDGRWGEVDAAAVWDPTFAEVEHTGHTRTIASSVVTSVIVMNDAWVAKHPGADARFLTALAMAYDVYRADPPRADRWFQQMAGLPFDLDVLTRAATVEPNLTAATAADLRVHLDEADIAGLREAAAFMERTGLLDAPLSVEAAIRPIARRPAPPVDTTGVTIRP